MSLFGVGLSEIFGGGAGGSVISVQIIGRIKARLRVSSLPIIPSEPIQPPNPYAVNLTERGLRQLDFTPIVAGDNYAIRVGLRTPDDSAAIDLSGALSIMTVSRKSGGLVLLTRRSDTGTQIVLDDQTTDNGPDGEDGRGWQQINFTTSEQEEMEGAAEDEAVFDLRANFGSTVVTLLRGRIEFLLPVTEEVA